MTEYDGTIDDSRQAWASLGSLGICSEERVDSPEQPFSGIDVRGTATFDGLNTVIRGRTLILCDCEGCEVSVLDTEKVPAMRTADLLIEAHDHLNDRITPTRKQRFAPTHDIEIIEARSRNPDGYPATPVLGSKDRARAVKTAAGISDGSRCELSSTRG